MVVGELLHLSAGRLNETLLTVAERDAPQARHALEEFTPLAVAHPHAAPAFDDQWTTVAMLAQVGQPVNKVSLVPRLG